MKKDFIQSLYKSIVIENKKIYIDTFENSTIDPSVNNYWRNALKFYSSLSYTDKEIFMTILEQIIIDTISTTLGAIDGCVTLENFKAKIRLLIDGEDSNGELHDIFLEFIEDNQLGND